jgi:hypothetical protein
MEADRLAMVASLVKLADVDTLYRDVYLDRACALLQPTFSAGEFHRLEQQRTALTTLTVELGRALDNDDWPLVRDLSRRAAALKETVEDTKEAVEIARGVYAAPGVRLDPFSPGLQKFTHIPAKELAGLGTRVAQDLTALEQADASWKEFYAARRTAVTSRAAAESAPADAAAGVASPAHPREAAAQALKSGDMARLGQLAEQLMQPATPSGSAARDADLPGVAAHPVTTGGDLLVTFPPETLARAGDLGLAPRRLPSRADLASLRQYAWNPLLEHSRHVDIKSVPLPAGSAEGLRDLVEMLIIHPLVNSGGARHLPTLVAEDMLIEDFPDPEDGGQTPPSQLLEALSLPGRRGLSRIAIEQALLAHGNRVVGQQLGLDPRLFRLVCIPSDAYVRLGAGEGWGRRPFWTHFDGYLVMPDGRLRALAGGDVRYGGLYELLGVGRDYDSDRLLARFAVVQRERMVAW